MYFDSEKLRQKPELYARPVMPEGQVTEPVQEVAEKPKGELAVLAEKVGNNLIEEVEAKQQLEAIKAKAKKVMSEVEYKRFVETLDDQIRVAKKRARTNALKDRT